MKAKIDKDKTVIMHEIQVIIVANSEGRLLTSTSRILAPLRTR